MKRQHLGEIQRFEWKPTNNTNQIMRMMFRIFKPKVLKIFMSILYILNIQQPTEKNNKIMFIYRQVQEDRII